METWSTEVQRFTATSLPTFGTTTCNSSFKAASFSRSQKSMLLLIFPLTPSSKTSLSFVVNNLRFVQFVGDVISSHVFRCVVTDLLNVKLFNGGKHFWGLSFYLPKFESVDKVSMTCDVFLCDVKRDGKELCDRSCDFSNFSSNTTTSSSVIHHSTSPIPLKEALKIVSDESDDLLSKPRLTDVNKFRDETQFKHETEFLLPPQRRKRRRRRRSLEKHVIEVGSEVFILVKDTGVGPLILKTGLLVTGANYLLSKFIFSFICFVSYCRRISS